MTETIKIGGMTCGGCVNSVKKALERLPINEARVEIGEVTVAYDEKMVDHNQVVRAIEDAGFEILTTQNSQS